MFRVRVSSWFGVFLCLLLVETGALVVVCYGADGHVTVEDSRDNCGSCVDIPIPATRVGQYTVTTKSKLLKDQFATFQPPSFATPASAEMVSEVLVPISPLLLNATLTSLRVVILLI